jgi:hypothetical protein
MRRLIALTALIASPVIAADDITSAYTDLNLDDCTIMQSDDFGSVWACPGYKGYPLRIAEGDLRFFVSYGFDAADEKAAEQTPPPFNYLGNRIEWRLSNRSGAWRPFATIVRYFVDKGDTDNKEGQVLVVTRIEPGATCQVAYVDASANSDANELAREAADTIAPDFDCANDPETSGDFSAW